VIRAVVACALAALLVAAASSPRPVRALALTSSFGPRSSYPVNAVSALAAGDL